MSRHRYDLPPEPRQHEVMREAVCIAHLVGLLAVATGVAALIGLALGSIITWVLP